MTNVENKKYLLTETYPSYIYENSDYIFHMINLTKILSYYDSLYDSMQSTAGLAKETALINRIDILKNQLLIRRKPRSLNFLGSAFSFVTGVPDHYDMVDIKEKINDIIENNNKQRLINTHFEKLLETFNYKTITQHTMLQEIHKELEDLALTINFARNKNFYSPSININDIEKIIKSENTEIPVINIMEYSDIHVCKINDTFIVVYKYPIIKEKCETFDVTPISYKHGKFVLDNKISRCASGIKRIDKCKNILSKYICKENKIDNCTIPILLNLQAQCKTVEENNEEIKEISEGNVLIRGINRVNNETYEGTYLIQFTNETKINNEIFHNQNEEIKQYILAQGQENIEILETLATDTKYKFNNIQKLHKLLIPYEEHPIKNTLITTTVIIVLGIMLYLGLKLYYAIMKCKTLKLQERHQKQNEIILKQQGMEHLIKKDATTSV